MQKCFYLCEQRFQEISRRKINIRIRHKFNFVFCHPRAAQIQIFRPRFENVDCPLFIRCRHSPKGHLIPKQTEKSSEIGSKIVTKAKLTKNKKGVKNSFLLLESES